jgi:hypothetical protein
MREIDRRIAALEKIANGPSSGPTREALPACDELAARIADIARESNSEPPGPVAQISRELSGRWTCDKDWNDKAMILIAVSYRMDQEIGRDGNTAGGAAAGDGSAVLLAELERRFDEKVHLIGSTKIWDFWDGRDNA